MFFFVLCNFFLILMCVLICSMMGMGGYGNIFVLEFWVCFIWLLGLMLFVLIYGMYVVVDG